MKSTTTSAIDLYISRVFQIVMLTYPCVALCAGGTYTVIKLLGYYPRVSWAGLLFLDATCLVYLGIGILFVRRFGLGVGRLRPDILKKGKIFIAVLTVVQWNLISYLVPSRDFWAYAAFFVMMSVLLLDSKFVLVITGEVGLSLVISWCIRGTVLLPMLDSYFVPNLILRVVFLILAFFFLWFITWLIETRLVRELEKLADYDALTMLRNRRSLDKTMEAWIRVAEETGEPFGVLMCDLDDFKKVNDAYGHDCGDNVLKFVANTLRRCAGGGDLLFRYGGEEILILVKGDRKTTESLANRILRDVEQGVIEYNGIPVTITLTIGGAMFLPDMAARELIFQADEAMYRGKSQGKNQVNF